MPDPRRLTPRRPAPAAPAVALLAACACSGSRSSTSDGPMVTGEAEAEAESEAEGDCQGRAGGTGWTCGEPCVPEQADAKGEPFAAGADLPVNEAAPGVCLLDHDGDGDLDAFLTGAGVLAVRDGDSWRDGTQGAGLAGAGGGRGCVAADLDNDGDPDLYETLQGPDRLWINSGGRFSDRSAALPDLPDAELIGQTVTAGDIEGDGDLDLYVVNIPTGADRAGPVPPPDAPAWLLVSRLVEDGALEFAEEGAARGLGERDQTWAAVFVDLDADGDVDLYKGNELGWYFADRLYVNDGAGRFVDCAPALGLDFADGQAKGACPQPGGLKRTRRDSADTMGVDVGDVDLDGCPDLVVTNYAPRLTLLFDCDPAGGTPDGALSCRDVSVGAGLCASADYTNWGVALVDLDHDGDLDLYTVTGHEDLPAARDQLYWNQGAGRFQEHLPAAGTPLARARYGLGAAFGDLDGDGDMDVITGTGAGAPEERVNVAADGNWLMVRLRGTLANRDGVGARVTVQPEGGCALTEHRMAGQGFLSSGDGRLHFGLGAAARARVTVAWPGPDGGHVQEVGTVQANRVVEVVEE